MATYQAFVGNTDNASIGDINVLKANNETTHSATQATFTDPTNFPGVTITITGTGITASPAIGWNISGISATLNGNPIWTITGITGVDGTPTSGTFDHTSIFQAVASGVAPDLIFAHHDNTIIGGPGDEGLFGFGRAGHTVIVHGSSGTEKIGGDGGNAILYAGTGHDAFLFNYDVFTGTNLSTIHRFNPSKDILELTHGDFQRTHFGVLTAAEFHSGPGAPSTTGADIVYNHTNGHLYYDSNGAAAGGLHLFAILTNHPALTAADFIVA
jgi:hypothetical protein